MMSVSLLLVATLYMPLDVHGSVKVAPDDFLANFLSPDRREASALENMPIEEYWLESSPWDDALLETRPEKHILNAAWAAVGRGGWIRFCCIAVCFFILGLVIAQSAFAGFSGKELRLFNSSSDRDRGGLHFALLAYWVFLMMDTGVLIPTSYELAIAMRSSASVSGIFLGCGYIATPIGSIAAAIVARRCSQHTSRIIGLLGASLLSAQNLAMAMILDSRSRHGPETMWYLIALRTVLGCGKIAYVVQYMAYNVTPRVDRTTLSIQVAIATNLGMCLGPYLSAFVIHLIGGREVVPSVYARTSAVLYLMAVLWGVLVLIFAIFMPTVLRSIPTPSTEAASDERSLEVARLAKCSIDDRKSVVLHAFHFSINRALASSAIEAGSAMILQTQFEWGSRAIGFSISAVFGITVVLCALILVMLRRRIVQDVRALMVLIGISSIGSVLYFDYGSGMAIQVLVADVMIYPSMFAANGIVDGIATSLAVPDTWYSMESYLGAKSLMGVPRFLAFPLVRYALEYYGRNLYAALLFLIGLLALGSAYTISDRVQWQFQERGSESSKA